MDPRDLDWVKCRPIPRAVWLQVLRAAYPQLRITDAYARLMVQRGGCRRAYPSSVGILAGGEVDLCVIADGKAERQ